MVYYCKKCGRQVVRLFSWEDVSKCDICNSKLFEVPHEYTDSYRWRDGDGKQAVIDELVKTSPEFDQYLFDHRDEILAKQNAEFNARMEIGKAIREGKKVSKEELLTGKLNNNQVNVTCPYCKSMNTTKITTASKVVNTTLFGLLGTKRHKQWHCNNCKSDF